MTAKERIHQLVDELPVSEMEAIERVLTDPWVRALLNTPEGEPPLTPGELAGLMQAKKEIEAGEDFRFSNVEDAIRWLHDGPAPGTK